MHVWQQRVAAACSHAAGRKGAGDSLSVTSRNTDKPVHNRLSKSEILRGYRAFGRVLSRRAYVKYERIRFYYDIKREIPPYQCMVGFAVRKAENAVQRNRLRRLLRESFRCRAHELREYCLVHQLQMHIVLLIDAQDLPGPVSFDHVDNSMIQLLESVLHRLREL